MPRWDLVIAPRYLKQPDEPSVLEHPVIQAIAQQQQATPAQVVLAWSMQRGWSVIPKSTNPGRIQENIAAISLVLSDSDMTQIAPVS